MCFLDAVSHFQFVIYDFHLKSAEIPFHGFTPQSHDMIPI